MSCGRRRSCSWKTRCFASSSSSPRAGSSGHGSRPAIGSSSSRSRCCSGAGLVKPETVLRWHRQGFRLRWAWRSESPSRPRTRVATAVVALIERMATENRRWGAERIRGELLKLGYSVAKSTIQRYMSRFRGRGARRLLQHGRANRPRQVTRIETSGADSRRRRAHRARRPRNRSPPPSGDLANRCSRCRVRRSCPARRRRRRLH